MCQKWQAMNLRILKVQFQSRQGTLTECDLFLPEPLLAEGALQLDVNSLHNFEVFSPVRGKYKRTITTFLFHEINEELWVHSIHHVKIPARPKKTSTTAHNLCLQDPSSLFWMERADIVPNFLIGVLVFILPPHAAPLH